MLFLALVLQMDIGTGHLVIVGGFAPRSGANVNNNDYDNDNIGVAPGVAAEILLLSLLSFNTQWGTDFIHPPIIFPIS